MSKTFHIYPPRDIFEHNLHGHKCECNPDIRVQQSGNVVVLHYAFDGRDLIEEIENAHLY